MIPSIWQDKSPINPNKTEKTILFILFPSSIPSPQKNVMMINPNMYPPLVPNSTPGPADIPAYTGTPTNPSNTYSIVAIVQYFLPNTYPAIATAKVCNVNGTPHGVGIVKIDNTEITAANIPIAHIALIDILFIQNASS